VTGSDDAVQMRAEADRIRDEVTALHQPLCRNGPSRGDGVIERENAELRRRLAAGHERLRELSQRLDSLRRGR
jgi:hypothetical protein